MKNKYGAILNNTSIEVLKRQIKDLSIQKFPPEAYYIVCNISEPPDSKELFDLLQDMNVYWKVKFPLNNETPDFLIDEYFKTGYIREACCLYIDGYPSLDLSEKLTTILEENPNKWIYCIDSHRFFYSKVMQRYMFTSFNNDIISEDHSDKVYCEYNNTV